MMADKYPEIFVLRHGETEWNRAGRFQGRLNSPLTEKGCGQALIQSGLLDDALADRAKFPAFCSPLERAAHTASIALEPLGLVATQDARLCEVAFGEFEGLTYEEVAKKWPQHKRTADVDLFDWHFDVPAGESLDSTRIRAKSFLDDLTGPSIIVTHGMTSRVLRGIWLGIDRRGMSDLPGGQGCVYHLRDGRQNRLG